MSNQETDIILIGIYNWLSAAKQSEISRVQKKMTGFDLDLVSLVSEQIILKVYNLAKHNLNEHNIENKNLQSQTILKSFFDDFIK